jgi:hypothetical protein
MSLPSNISTDYLSVLNEYYYGSSMQSKLWQRFTSLYNVSPDSATPELVAKFRELVQRYNARGFASDTLTGQITLPSSSDYSFYKNFLMAFYGNYSEFEQNDIWEAFVRSQGLTTLPADSPSLRAAFSKFIKSLRDREVSLESDTSLSPSEKKSRLFINDVIEGLRGILDATTELVKRQADLLMFYGKRQEEYTKEMTRIPTLIPGEAGTISFGDAASIDALDFSNFTFGYYNVTFREVIEYGLNQAVGLNKEWSWSPSAPSATTPVGTYKIDMVTNSSGKKVPRVHFLYGLSGQTPPDNFQDVELPNVPTSDPTYYQQLLTNTETAFKTVFKNFTSNTTGKGFMDELKGQPAIPGRWLSKDNTEEVEARTEENAILQQYVENIKSLRTVVRSLTTKTQADLQTTREAINQCTSLWTTILESLDSIIHQIFAKG